MDAALLTVTVLLNRVSTVEAAAPVDKQNKRITAISEHKMLFLFLVIDIAHFDLIGIYHDAFSSTTTN